MGIQKTAVPTLRFPEFVEPWKFVSLGDIANVKTGNKDTQDREENGIYPFFVRSNTVERINSYGFDGEAILTSGDGVGVGKNFHYVNGKFNYHQRVYNIHNFKENTFGKFIYFYFANAFYDRVKRLSAKNSVDSVRMDMITGMPIPLPDVTEQQKIASFLSAVDKKIEQLKKKKELLEQYKKGVMQQIFSQEIRFKDDDGNDYPKWEEKHLLEIATKESSNIAASAVSENEGEYTIYGASGALKSIDFYTQEHPYISIVKDGAGVGRVLICEGKSSVLGTLDVIKPVKNVNIYFLYAVLQQIEFSRFTKGSTIPHIYFKDYGKERILLPTSEEQIKIGCFYRDLDKKTSLTEKEIESAELFKKGLLQQMFV